MTSLVTEPSPGQFQFSVAMTDLSPGSGVVLGHVNLAENEAVRLDYLALYFAGWTELGSIITAAPGGGTVQLGLYTDLSGEPLVNLSLTVPGDDRLTPGSILRGPATYYVVLRSAATACSLCAEASAVLTPIANV